MAIEAEEMDALTGGGQWTEDSEGEARPLWGKNVSTKYVTGARMTSAVADLRPKGPIEDRLIDRWVRLACTHSRTRRVAAKSWVADVVGLDGAWADGSNRAEALAGLPGVVDEWVRMKLADNDTDLPLMEGLALVVEQ